VSVRCVAACLLAVVLVAARAPQGDLSPPAQAAGERITSLVDSVAGAADVTEAEKIARDAIAAIDAHNTYLRTQATDAPTAAPRPKETIPAPTKSVLLSSVDTLAGDLVKAEDKLFMLRNDRRSNALLDHQQALDNIVDSFPPLTDRAAMEKAVPK